LFVGVKAKGTLSLFNTRGCVKTSKMAKKRFNNDYTGTSGSPHSSFSPTGGSDNFVIKLYYNSILF